MTLQLTYPGVYVQEIPSGTHTISGVATSITAFVGYLTRGPMNTPVQCLNFGDFQRVFGGLGKDSVTSFQVSQFFLNGGTEAWISRLCATSAPPVQPQAVLSSTIPSSSGGGGSSGKGPALTSGNQVMTLLSANPGTWGENIFVTVDYMTNKINTFNLTATLYSTASNSNSSSTSYSVSQTQTVPSVTLDLSQANSIVEVMQSGNQNSALLAVPVFTAQPAEMVPFASGTMLSVPMPVKAASNVTISVSVQAPTPAGGKEPGVQAVPAFTVPFKIASLGDLIAAIQSAMSNAAGYLKLPSLAGTIVRSCLSPFAPTTDGAAQTQLIQVLVPDPGMAGYLISVSCSQSSLCSTFTTNYQAQQLGVTTTPANPNGIPPTGIDIAGNSTSRTGVYALDAMRLVNLLCVPDMENMDTSNYLTAATATLNYAIQRRAFAILDLPVSVQSVPQAVDWATNQPGTFGQGIISGASYFPQVQIPNPFSTQLLSLGGSGTLAGVYAMTDAQRGVWKAPAGITAPLAGVQQLAYVMNDQENGQINPLGLNALRTFPTYDNISWGARTLASANAADDDWKYISVRRLALYMEQSLVQGLQWVVFEPNGPSLWSQIRLSVNGFLHPLYLQGAFVGATPSQAYQVICDESTTTPEDMDNGIVNILILFAPIKPAEFVVISLQQMAGQSSS